MITLPRTKHSQSHKESQPRKWLSTKNRSPWRSTPRHPIVMSSTAKTPDPMSCALAAVLLPELRAHGCHMQKTLFPAPHARWGCVCSARACVQGTLMRRGRAEGVGSTLWVPGGGAWHSGKSEAVGLRLGAPGGCTSVWSRGGPVVTVSSCGVESGMRGHLGWCSVRWLFQNCCSRGSLGPWSAAAWNVGGLQKRS
jgi:hypothetical protein